MTSADIQIPVVLVKKTHQHLFSLRRLGEFTQNKTILLQSINVALKVLCCLVSERK